MKKLVRRFSTVFLVVLALLMLTVSAYASTPSNDSFVDNRAVDTATVLPLCLDKNGNNVDWQAVSASNPSPEFKDVYFCPDKSGLPFGQYYKLSR
jgi:hypothetical protein